MSNYEHCCAEALLTYLCVLPVLLRKLKKQKHLLVNNS